YCFSYIGLDIIILHDISFRIVSHRTHLSVSSDEHETIPPFPLLDLLPSPNVNYFRYYGSLTTPPCYESVIWSIATQQIEIAEDQVEIFRGLYDSANHTLVDDFRPLQLLNERTVQVSHRDFAAPTGDTSAYVTSSVTTVAMFSLLALWAAKAAV
ncbi:hypothetical protein EGW08_013546, partial [Elysia chlorotica]